MKNKSKLIKSNSESRSIKEYFKVSKNLSENSKSDIKVDSSELILKPVMSVSKSEELCLNYINDYLDVDEDDDAFVQPISNNNRSTTKNNNFEKSNTIATKRKKNSKRAKTEEEQFEIDLAIKVSKLTQQPEIRRNNIKSNNTCQLLPPLVGRQLVNSKLLDWLQTIPDFIPAQNFKNDKIFRGELWSELSFEKVKKV